MTQPTALQAADHGGHAAQGGLQTGATGFAQGDEPGRDFDDQYIQSRDVGDRLRVGLGHDGTPFRPTPGVDAVGDSKPHRAQARHGLRSADHWSASPRPSRAEHDAMLGRQRWAHIRKIIGTRRLGAPHPAIADQANLRP